MELVLYNDFKKKCIYEFVKNSNFYIVHLFFITILLYYIYGTETDLILLRISQFLGLILFLLNMPYLFKKNNNILDIRFTHFNLILLISIISLIVCKLTNKDFYIFDVLYPFLFFGVVVSLIKFGLSYKFTLFLYYFIHTYLFYKLLTQPNPDLWVRGSSNQVSVILLSITILFYIEKIRINENLPVIHAIPTFLLCVFAQGTSGIICAFLLLSVLIYKKAKGRYFIKLVIFKIFILVTYLIYTNLFSILFFIREFINTFIMLLDGKPRLGVIYFYFNSTSLYEFLFGNKVALIEYEMLSSLSSHNSFLSIHASLGFGFIILICINFFTFINLYKKSRFLFFIFLS